MGYFTANVKFNYSKPIPFWMRPGVEREYLRLRSLACNALNPHYDEWNKEYKTLHPAEIVDPDDELKDFGGTEYCRFLNNKQQPIIDEVNRKYATGRVRLYPSKECDLAASIHGRNNKQISTIHITLCNVSEIVWEDVTAGLNRKEKQVTRRIESYEDFVQQWDETLTFLREQGMDNGYYRIGDFITNDGVCGYSIAGLYNKVLKGESSDV